MTVPKSKNFPFEYVVEAKESNSEQELKIETPWFDDDRPFNEQFERDDIYVSDDLIIYEQKYENNFHILFIQTADKIILKSNWELDPQSDGSFLPRIQ